MNFNSVMIGSEDPKRLVDYYTKILGKPAMSEGGYDGWQIGSGWITIGPHDQVKGKNPSPGRLILNIESQDVKGDFEKFRAAGAKVVREPYNVGEVRSCSRSGWTRLASSPCRFNERASTSPRRCASSPTGASIASLWVRARSADGSSSPAGDGLRTSGRSLERSPARTDTWAFACRAQSIFRWMMERPWTSGLVTLTRSRPGTMVGSSVTSRMSPTS
jgi:hypothetical protein